MRFVFAIVLLYGEVYATSSRLEGVSLWLPSEKAEMTLLGMIRAGGFSTVKIYLFPSKLEKEVNSRALPSLNYLSSNHKRLAPFRHWYLQFLGVDPVLQGEGYGSILLKSMLARIDQERLPCYLENTNEKNMPFYQHNGFRVLDKTKIPGTEIFIYVMLREKYS